MAEFRVEIEWTVGGVGKQAITRHDYVVDTIACLSRVALAVG